MGRSSLRSGRTVTCPASRRLTNIRAGSALRFFSRMTAVRTIITRLSACDTRTRSPKSVTWKRYRLSVRSPSIQKRPMPYQRK